MDVIAQSPGRQRAAILFAVAPPLALAAWLGYVLLRPLASASTRQWALDAPMLMAMEFLLVHFGFFFLVALTQRTRWRRAAIGGAICAFYLLFMGAFWYLSGGSGVIGAAMALLATRLASGVLATPDQSEIELRHGAPIFNAVLYLSLVAITTVPRGFPAFGFTRDVIAQLRPEFGTAQGLWVDQPQRVVAFGALYFLIQGLFELARLRSVVAGSDGWTRIHGANVRATPKSFELRSSGSSGALAIGTMWGGVPLFLGLSLALAREVERGWAIVGYVLCAGGTAVLAYQLWRASCRVTTFASRNLLEVECSWIVGYGKLRLDAAALKQLVPDEPAGGGLWSLVLRDNGGKIEIARNLASGGDTLAIRQLIAARVQGPQPAKVP